jgi:hypothetical protein
MVPVPLVVEMAANTTCVINFFSLYGNSRYTGTGAHNDNRTTTTTTTTTELEASAGLEVTHPLSVLYWAMFEICDLLGEYEQAWEYLTKARLYDHYRLENSSYSFAQPAMVRTSSIL